MPFFRDALAGQPALYRRDRDASPVCSIQRFAKPSDGKGALLRLRLSVCSRATQPASLDITPTVAHCGAMERSTRKDARFHEQELVGSWRIIRWLGKLLGKDGALNHHATMNNQSGNPGHEPDSPTEEFLAVLPDGVADELGLDEDANRPIYPDAIDISLADFDRTNPAVWASDWRLLAPSDSDEYKEAVEKPKEIADIDKRVINAVAKTVSQTTDPTGINRSS